MEPSRQTICPERLRRVPAQFSWIDQRLVRERYLERIDAHACALYLFLVTVADSRGLSWYGDAAIARRLGIDELRLGRARADLVRVGLVAHRAPLYQVLALDGAAPVQVAPPAPSCCGAHASSPIDARAQLAALHAVLARRP